MHRIACAAALFATIALSAQPRPLAPEQIRRIDALFAAYDKAGSPGYAVGVVRDGALVFARGYGRADLDHDRPITPRTSFHLASLSKQFTAAAVALLILDGKLSLDTPVAQHIPEAKKFGDGLRVAHLMYFTSGIPEYYSQPRASGRPWFSAHYFDIDEAIAASLRAEKLQFEPGTRWAYSNINYMLLARIVERISGMPLAAFLEQRIFAPLGMRDTHLNDDPTLIVPNRATGYADRGNANTRRELAEAGVQMRAGSGWARMVRNSPHYGGSGVFSTIADLAKWDAEFGPGAKLGPRFAALMMQRRRFAHPKDNDVFGLVIGKYRDREMVWYAGGDIDASTYMARLPAERLTVFCLSNMGGGNAEGKVREILGIVLP